METFVITIIDSFKSILAPQMIIFILSLLPIIELRGGIIAGTVLGINWPDTYAVCVFGNLLPIPFIVIFIRKIFEWLKNTGFVKLIKKIENRAEKKIASVKKYKFWGLFLFVAIPMPGTGAWTGALLAAMLNMRLKDCMPPILFGVLTSGLIVTLLSYGILKIVS